jgi:L-seryl-tRNA(Ser) seleniumtransferase
MAGQEALRQLPSVDRVLRELEKRGVLVEYPRRAARLCAREILDEARGRLRAGGSATSPDRLVGDIEIRLRRRFGATLRRAINATGVILHTNLGRAPLSRAAQAAVADAAAGYSTLEIDLASGERGSRHVHLEPILTAVTGAEAGFAVNNAAGAVVLSLAALAGDRAVAVSRGELVEIGGSFRMPDVMRASHARLIEVGTTNRTYVADYEAALDLGAGVLLKVHQSNFRQRGFVHEVPLGDLARLGRNRDIPVVFDLGSGCLVDLSMVGLPPEPTVQAALAAGADLVLFSGDKLLGGPQAGLIAGRQAAVERCRRHPLARAFRLDKLDLAALTATLRAYLDHDTVWSEIPLLGLLASTQEDRRRRARRLARAVSRRLGDAAEVSTVDTSGEVGGGSLPGVAVASCAVRIAPVRGHAEAWAARLRQGRIPVIGVVREGALLLDVLALLPGEDRALAGLIAAPPEAS